MGSVRAKRGVFREPRKDYISDCTASQFRGDHESLCKVSDYELSPYSKSNMPEKITIPTKQQTLSWMLNNCILSEQRKLPRSSGDDVNVSYQNPLIDSITTRSENPLGSSKSKLLSSEKSSAKFKFRQKIRDSLRKSRTKPPTIPEIEVQNSDSYVNLAEVVSEPRRPIPTIDSPTKNLSRPKSSIKATPSPIEAPKKESDPVPNPLSQIADTGSRFPLEAYAGAPASAAHLRQLMRKYTLLKLDLQKRRATAAKVDKATQMYEHVTTSRWHTQTWIETYLFCLDGNPPRTLIVDGHLSSPSLKKNLGSNCGDVIMPN